MERRQIMKRFLKTSLLAIATFVTALSISGCKVDEGGIYGAFPYMNVPFADTLLSKVQQTVTIPIETNRTISANVTDALWLKAKTDGKNLILEAEPNDLETERTATVEITTVNSTIKSTITVTQDASGELTISGDLILKSIGEIETNTYTKTKESLIIGNVISIQAATADAVRSAATDGEVTFPFGGYRHLTVAPSNISNREISLLDEQIHLIGQGSMALANTEVTRFPYNIIHNNNVTGAYVVACELTSLPTSDSLSALTALTDLDLTKNHIEDITPLSALGGLKYLNLSDNEVEDISALADLQNLQTLVLDNNDIIDIEPIAKLPNISNLSLKGLPILPTQYDILRESLPADCVGDTTGLRSEESPLINIGLPAETSHSENSFIVCAKLKKFDEGIVNNPGFYWGNSKKLAQMEFIPAIYSEVDSTIFAEITNVDTQNNVYFFRGYAENKAGKSYSDINRFGDIIQVGNYYINNSEEFETFYNAIITQIEGSLFIGYGVLNGDGTIIDVPVGDTLYKFGISDITSLQNLSNISRIKDGLYVVNNPITNISEVSKLEELSTLWVEGNKITNIPELTNISGLKTINIARNEISDISPLLKLTGLDTLYLGNENYTYEETNRIGVLTGLEKLTNLKHLDLSGLPLHNWQVKDLRNMMPGCNIVFTPGNRTPFLPVVRSESASISGSTVTVRGYLENKGEGQVLEYGFYWGKDLENLTKVTAGTEDLSNGATFSYTLNIPDEERYLYIPYAVNTYGEVKGMNSLEEFDYKEFTLSYINLSERGTSNSYIVSNAGRYTILANVIGNGSAGIIDTANFHTSDVNIYPTNAGLVWQTSDDIIQDIVFLSESQEILITTSGKEGNALIAALDDSNNILWSWHIWCTDKPVDHKYINYSGQRFTVQDRNLGATRADRGTGDEWIESTGLLFLWGRKDPINYNQYNTTQSKLTIEETVLYPTIFPTHMEWMANRNKYLWTRKVKTIYDPCPVGYKVANRDVWTGFSTTGMSTSSHSEINIKGSWDNGYYFIYDGTNTAWYPTSYNNSYAESYCRIWYSDGDYKDAFNNGWDEGNDWTCPPLMEYYYNTDIDASVRFDGNWAHTGSPSYVRCMLDEGFIDARLPEVVSDEVVVLNSHSAKAVGYVNSQGESDITARGFVWGKQEYPKLGVDKSVEVAPGDEGFISKFEAVIDGLDPGSTYYIRPYATSALGTGYGKPMKIKTKDGGSSEDVGRDDDFEW